MRIFKIAIEFIDGIDYIAEQIFQDLVRAP